MNNIGQIFQALHRGTLTLFVGADLPPQVTGLPSRADLARDLARRHSLAESGSLAAVASQVGRHGQRFQFISFLRDQLDATSMAPQAFHRRVVELVQRHDVATLVTTAYDDLLKRAFEAKGAPLDVVVRGSAIQFANPRTPTLIKLYGDLQQPDTLIVTEDDHYGLWHDRDKEALLDEVRVALKKNAVLFLGYSLADPDFNLLWREVLDKAGQFAIGAYAAWPSASKAQKQVWEDRHVRVFDLPALDLLGELLGEDQVKATGEVKMPGVVTSTKRKRPSVSARSDRLATIRELLRAAFTSETLPRFCVDRPAFRPIVDEFGARHGLNDMIDEVITYCSKHLLLDDLLTEVKSVNPRQYERFESEL